MPVYKVSLMRREIDEDEEHDSRANVPEEELLYRMRQFLMEPFFDKERYYLKVEVM